MKRILSPNAAPPIGPYSQAIEANGFVFVSGQIALNSKGELISDEVEQQTKQVISNLKEVLLAAGSGLENIVKTTIYLADMNDFSAVNEVYASFFGETKPARATVEVSRLPKDVRVEIDCIAAK